MNGSDLTPSASSHQESASSLSGEDAAIDAMHGADLFTELSARVASLASMLEAHRGGPVQPHVRWDPDVFYAEYAKVQRHLASYGKRPVTNRN